MTARDDVRELLDAVREYVKAERADQFGEGMADRAEAAAVDRATEVLLRLGIVNEPTP